MIDGIMYKKNYKSNRRKHVKFEWNVTISKIKFNKHEQKPKADSNAWYAFLVPDTVTTGLWKYTTKSIEQINNKTF